MSRIPPGAPRPRGRRPYAPAPDQARLFDPHNSPSPLASPPSPSPAAESWPDWTDADCAAPGPAPEEGLSWDVADDRWGAQA
jgi:hypothetical protein